MHLVAGDIRDSLLHALNTLISARHLSSHKLLLEIEIPVRVSVLST